MFWALNGATLTPFWARMRQRAAVMTLFPTEELVPWIMRAFARVGGMWVCWRFSQILIFIPYFDRDMLQDDSGRDGVVGDAIFAMRRY